MQLVAVFQVDLKAARAWRPELSLKAKTLIEKAIPAMKAVALERVKEAREDRERRDQQELLLRSDSGTQLLAGGITVAPWSDPMSSSQSSQGSAASFTLASTKKRGMNRRRGGKPRANSATAKVTGAGELQDFRSKDAAGTASDGLSGGSMSSTYSTMSASALARIDEGGDFQHGAGGGNAMPINSPDVAAVMSADGVCGGGPGSQQVVTSSDGFADGETSDASQLGTNAPPHYAGDEEEDGGEYPSSPASSATAERRTPGTVSSDALEQLSEARETDYLDRMRDALKLQLDAQNNRSSAGGGSASAVQRAACPPAARRLSKESPWANRAAERKHPQHGNHRQSPPSAIALPAPSTSLRSHPLEFGILKCLKRLFNAHRQYRYSMVIVSIVECRKSSVSVL